MKLRWPRFFILIAILLLLGGGIWLIIRFTRLGNLEKQNVAGEANLNTYTNNAFGYSFEYPKNLVLTDPLNSTQIAYARTLVLVDPNILASPDPDRPEGDQFGIQIVALDVMPEPPSGWVEVVDEKKYKYTRKYISPNSGTDTEIYYMQLRKGGMVVVVKKEMPKETVEAILTSFTFQD